jgi:methionine-gamma-lyase
MNAACRTGFATRAIHHGYDPLDHQGALVPPVHLSATFAFPDTDDGMRRFTGETVGYVYTRIANPTLALLEARLAALEGGAAAVVFSSGMGAITATLWTLLAPGDEVLVDTTLYGCTFAFMHHGLGRFGVRIRHADLTDAAALEAQIGARTKLVYFESPANPNMRLVDIAAVSRAARRRGVLVAVDNTYCSPYLQRPLELGADIVLHSATKYLGGHGDLSAGAAVFRDAELAQRVRLQGLKDLTGAVLSPQDAFLVLRGLKTLALRMRQHCANAQAVAELLAAHPAVEVVHYPGLASFPQYALAQQQMKLPGGMIAFELRGGLTAGKRFLDALQLVTRAVSLGDAESLAQHPASMTHSTYTREERRAHGIAEGLVRISAGLEDTEDLLADVRQALDAVAGRRVEDAAVVVSP